METTFQIQKLATIRSITVEDKMQDIQTKHAIIQFHSKYISLHFYQVPSL